MSPLVLVLGLALAAPAGGAQERAPAPPLASGAIRALELPPPPAAREEHLRLDPPAGAGEEPLGLVRQLLVAEPGGSFRLEREVHLFAEATRVVHVERLLPGELALVWRELGPGRGRTVLVEWTRAGAALRVADAEGRTVVRRELDASAGALLPLYVLEKLRAGHLAGGTYRVVDPLGGGVEARELRALPPLPPWPSAAPLRRYALVRPDGTLALEAAFRGRGLAALRWQAGGPVARAIPADEHARLLAERWREPAPRPGGGEDPVSYAAVADPPPGAH